MIAKQVIITKDYLVDEATNVGIWNGEYAVFDENGAWTPIDACAVARKYLEAALVIPPEFAAVRDCLEQRKLAYLHCLGQI